MGSNHMHEILRNSTKNLKNMREIPTHDPYTGELNPYYEELTGKKNPLNDFKKSKVERFNEEILKIANNKINIDKKILLLQKYIDSIDKEVRKGRKRFRSD